MLKRCFFSLFERNFILINWQEYIKERGELFCCLPMCCVYGLMCTLISVFLSDFHLNGFHFANETQRERPYYSIYCLFQLVANEKECQESYESSWMESKHYTFQFYSLSLCLCDGSHQSTLNVSAGLEFAKRSKTKQEFRGRYIFCFFFEKHFYNRQNYWRNSIGTHVTTHSLRPIYPVHSSPNEGIACVLRSEPAHYVIHVIWWSTHELAA